MTRKKHDLFSEKVENKSLNIKIPESLYNELDAIRAEARKQGKTFKVNGFVTEFLEGLVKDAKEQLGMVEKEEPKKTTRRAPRSSTKKVEN